MAGIPEQDDLLPGGPPPPHNIGEGRAITPPTKIMEMRRQREEKRLKEREAERRRQLLKQTDAGVADSQPRQPLVPVSQGDKKTNPTWTPGPTDSSQVDTSGVDPSVLKDPLARRVSGSRNTQAAPKVRTVAPQREPEQPAQPLQAPQTSHPIQTQTSTRTQQPNPRPQPADQTRTRSKTTSSFPHAFERWETLSSHWEGLTGYWIKKLDENKDELSKQPLNQQLARQVTDLSAAGANLFHAVVELQRLRASSERKFQRWFFETRKEQEQTNEKIAFLEKELKSARQNAKPLPVTQADIMADPMVQDQIRTARLAAQQSAQEEIERANAKSAKQLAEMRRELQISRDEARRGWEEIGRMEQSERDRMFSLKQGQPTIVGGVQVLPMPPQATSSTRPTVREGGLSSHPVQADEVQYSNYQQPQYAYQDYQQQPHHGDERARSESDTDPFIETAASLAPGSKVQTQVPANYPASTAAMTAGTRGASASPALRPATSAGTSPQPSTSRAPHSEAGSFVPSRSEGDPTAPHAPAPPSGPSSSTGTAFYQQPPLVLHQAAGSAQPQVLHAEDARSYGTISEEEYMVDHTGQPIRDEQGRLIPYRSRHDARSPSEASEDYGQPLTAGTGYAGYQAAQQIQRSAAVTSNGNGHAIPAPDYEGSGYGPGGEWSAVPRHQHPTRLSDVLEEDERSRTSPSRASERSRGFR